MDKSERQMRYLEVYRQQLRREMDAMGYGQPRGYAPNHELQARTRSRTRSTSYWMITALAFALLGSG
jgi:hypothetical protein